MPFSFSSTSSSGGSDDSMCTETYFWGCTLTKNRPSVEWHSNREDNECHSLNLKQSVLGVDAVMNQRNVVQVETLNVSKELIHLPILSLTLGRNDMCSLDLHFESGDPVTFRLIEGNGPVHIAAEHAIECDDEDDDDSVCGSPGKSASKSACTISKPRAKIQGQQVKRGPPSVSLLSASGRTKLDNIVDSVTSSTACVKVKKPVASPVKPTTTKLPRAKKSPVAKQMTKASAKPKTSKRSPKKKTASSSRKMKTKPKAVKLEAKATTDRRKSCAL